MQKRTIAGFVGLGMSLMLAQQADASVQPAPPAFIDAIAKQIVPTPTEGTFDQYLAVFADDLTVMADGKQVAASKAAWSAGERRKLGKVDRFVIAYAEGFDAILVIERYDDRSDLPSSPAMLVDPRYQARAIRYAVGADHRIHTIQIVQTDGIFRVPK